MAARNETVSTHRDHAQPSSNALHQPFPDFRDHAPSGVIPAIVPSAGSNSSSLRFYRRSARRPPTGHGADGGTSTVPSARWQDTTSRRNIRYGPVTIHGIASQPIGALPRLVCGASPSGPQLPTGAMQQSRQQSEVHRPSDQCISSRRPTGRRRPRKQRRGGLRGEPVAVWAAR
jgi:hypothetical protein